ncbi:hypothetical protein [Trichococcus alkaliphilus]|uniref:hypothetical protein n=1 Tax=Trichococcus alkaliphilus TaxID=2052943 RepID=UPI000D0B04F2|nr:hypothetical protein [Trichococcus alkaliphilus]
MGLFDFFRKKTSYPAERQQPEESPVLQAHTGSDGSMVRRAEVDFTRTISDKEREVAAVVTAAILSGSNDSAHMRVRKVTGIDTDKEIAAAIVAAIAAHDKFENSFRLHSITRVK